MEDNNLKFDENGRKLSKQVENTVGKGEIARLEQFLLFPHCFQKACFLGASKGVIVWEWVRHFILYQALYSREFACVRGALVPFSHNQFESINPQVLTMELSRKWYRRLKLLLSDSPKENQQFRQNVSPPPPPPPQQPPQPPHQEPPAQYRESPMPQQRQPSPMKEMNREPPRCKHC